MDFITFMCALSGFVVGAMIAMYIVYDVDSDSPVICDLCGEKKKYSGLCDECRDALGLR